jgi:multisubunit Na+/H+ antiporter MnhG subunit
MTNFVFTRLNIAVILLLLTAITLFGQYVMLAHSLFGGGEALPWWFLVAEKSIWGFRGIVEVGIVMFVGMTKTNDKATKAKLWVIDIVLIGLVIVTVGPILSEWALGESVVVIFGRQATIVWAFLVAGITAMMIAGVSYAYTIQPHNENIMTLEQDEYNNLLERLKAEEALAVANSKIGELTGQVEKLAGQLDAAQIATELVSLIPGTQFINLLHHLHGGEIPQDIRDLSEATGLNEVTIRNAVRALREKNGGQNGSR